MDVLDGWEAHAKAGCDLSLRQRAAKGPDFAHVSTCEFCGPNAFTSAMRSMSKPISLVFLRRLPRKVALRSTGNVAVTARVRGLMPWRRAGSVFPLANQNMDVLNFAIDADLPIASRCSRVRPKQAVVPIVRENNFAEMPQGNTMRSRSMRLVVGRDRAYSWVSHVNLLTGWLGQSASRCFQHPARSPFVPQFSRYSKEAL